MAKIQFKTGQVFNRLTFIEELEQVKYVRYAKFRCICGNDCVKDLISVRNSVTKSCGCLNAEVRKRSLADRNRTHGLTATTGNTRGLYTTYLSIKERCYNPKSSGYRIYGARGIVMCDEWLNDALSFIDWGLNNGYAKGLHIDRIDVNGNYEPTNCRYITPKENQNNKRNNRNYEYKGVTKTLAQHIEDSGMNKHVIRGRVANLNWSIEKALETPIKTQYNNGKYKRTG